MVHIIPFNAQFATYFYNLNIEWLQTYFYVEPFDEEVLSKPEKYIIDKGGYIFFAKHEAHIIATVALMPTADKKVLELTKMAVSPKHRGHRTGQKMVQHCIDFAKNNDMTGLVLYSNRVLENAIHIYKKYGFVEIPVEANSPYKRSDIKMILDLKS